MKEVLAHPEYLVYIFFGTVIIVIAYRAIKDASGK